MPDWEKLREHLEGPIPSNLMKILALSTEQGWNPDPVTVAMRMSKPGCHPCFAVWTLNRETMRWSFSGARVNLVYPGFSGKLTLRDLGIYLANPEAIEVEEVKKGVSAWKQAGSAGDSAEVSGR